MRKVPTDYFVVANQFKDPNSFFDAHWWKQANTCYHTHGDFYELFFTTTSNYIHFYQDKNTVLPACTVCLLPPKTSHQLLCTGEQHDSHRLAHFNLDLTIPFFDDFMSRNEALLPMRHISEPLIFSLNKYEYAYINYLAKQLTYRATDATNYKNIVELLLTNILMLSVKNDCFSGRSANHADAYIRNLKEKFDNYEMLSTPIQEIYSSGSYSSPILIEKFKNLTGKTIVEYRAGKRIQYAKMLLLSTDYSVLEIANKVGYYSQSYFIKHFKQVTGITPLQFRNS